MEVHKGSTDPVLDEAHTDREHPAVPERASEAEGLALRMDIAIDLLRRTASRVSPDNGQEIAAYLDTAIPKLEELTELAKAARGAAMTKAEHRECIDRNRTRMHRLFRKAGVHLTISAIVVVIGKAVSPTAFLLALVVGVMHSLSAGRTMSDALHARWLTRRGEEYVAEHFPEKP